MEAIVKEASRNRQSDNDEEDGGRKHQAMPKEGDSEFLHLCSDEILLIMSYEQPQDTSSLLLTCKTTAKLARPAWKAKVDAMADDFILPYAQDTAASDARTISEAQHWNIQLWKRYQRLTRYRPTIERWGEPPYWYPDHPEPSSPFHAVRRAHDVTDFRLNATTGHLGPGTYAVSWRVNSTSGFCELQLDTTAILLRNGPTATDIPTTASISSTIWNSRADRGSGWKEVGVGVTNVQLGPNGGIIAARMWKRELDFTGGIMVDCLIVKRIPDAPSIPKQAPAS
eukprot:CAMPEP_0178652340 /NCGR_PEP_ID=MMETSP0698-20121128/22590_1 /TAXON_ID=265572 /ORGANISM="Extubocellulus spinifer, Strain CCMP396" /LENGTH=282 /DNA_ID=CAMNT_0020294025 /DNA_START=39 /DNA_END=887 /DNA_ORIENTATION=+